jgi:hypothetical protein
MASSFAPISFRVLGLRGTCSVTISLWRSTSSRLPQALAPSRGC